MSVSDATDLVTAAPEDVGVLAERPVLVVDLDGAQPDELARLTAVTARLPCVAVGVARSGAPVADLDVLLTEAAVDPGPGPGPPWRWCPDGVDAAVAELVAAVDRSPRAATVLVQLLRLGRGRSLDDGITVESLAYATLQAGPEHQAWLASRVARPRALRVLGSPAEPVGVERDGPTLLVTLRRPHVRNAVDTATRDGLVAAFELAAADDTVTRVEWRGEGADFCSGGDLDEFGTAPDPTTAHLVRSTRSPARALARVVERTRVEAVVQGACIGAGLELAALAHHVTARPDATFRLPELAMGLVPGAGGTATILRRIGPQLTAWMALTGTPVDAPTAVSWGLADTLA